MFSVNLHDMEQLQKILLRLNHRGLPTAILFTLNDMARLTFKEGRSVVRDEFINRTAWTRRSVVFDKAKGFNYKTMQSEAGSLEGYMLRQEEGHQRTKGGKHGIAIPTGIASGEGRDAKPRRKKVRKAAYLSRIKLAERRKGVNRKQTNILAIKRALKDRRRFVYLDLGRRQGIFRVEGTRKNIDSVNLVYDLTQTTVTTKATHWLERSRNKATPRMEIVYKRHLVRQLKRAGFS